MTAGTSLDSLTVLDQFSISSIFSLLNTNNSIPRNTTLTDEIPSFISNVSSLSNSVVFLVAFSIFLAIVGYLFFVKGRKMMIKRNQWVLIGLVTSFVIIQMIALAFRVVYNGISLNYNLNSTNIVELDGLFIFTQLCAMAETAIVEIQSITIFVIMGFIQNVFLHTAHHAGSMSKKQFIIMKFISNILTLVSSVITLILVIIIAVTNFLVKTHIAKFDQTIVYVLTLLIFIIEVTIETVLYVYFGIKVLKTIKQRSLNLKQESNRNAFVNAIQKPLTKTLVLLISMGISTFLQVLAAVAAVLSSSFDSNTNVISYFLNSFGVLLFASCVVLMYNPLLSDEYNNIDLYEAKERERNLLLNETSSNGSELSPRGTSRSFFSNSPRNISNKGNNWYNSTVMESTSSGMLLVHEDSNVSKALSDSNTTTTITSNDCRKSIGLSALNIKDISPTEESTSISQEITSITSPPMGVSSSENLASHETFE